VVQSLFGGVDPGFEPVPVPVFDPDQYDPSKRSRRTSLPFRTLKLTGG
jgi:hypothetical protein